MQVIFINYIFIPIFFLKIRNRFFLIHFKILNNQIILYLSNIFFCIEIKHLEKYTSLINF